MSRRILFFTDNPVFGGGNKYLIDLIKSVKNDFEIFVLANKSGLFEEERRQLPGINLRSRFIFKRKEIKGGRYPVITKIVEKITDLFLPVLFILNTFSFLFFLKKIKPALVVTCNGGYPGAESTLAMALASRVLNIPVLLSIVSMPQKRRKLLWVHDLILDKITTRCTSKIIVNSKAQLLSLKNLRGFNEANIVCIYNGIEDIPAIKKSSISPESQSFLTFGYVGRLDKLKGIEYVLHAIAQSNEKDRIRLTIVGEGPEMRHLVQLSTSLNLDDKIKFTGFSKENIMDIHKNFDVFIFPSLWEGLPYSILEAMRSGLPVISTNVGGIPEAVSHLETGLLVDPGNSGELSKAIDRIATKNLITSFSKNARKKFETDFTLNVMYQKFFQLASETIQKN